MKRSRILLITGVSLLVLAVIWLYAIAPRWTQRLPAGWEWRADYIGFITYSDPVTGTFPEVNTVGVYSRWQRIIADEGRPKTVQVEDAYEVHEISTGQITWQYFLTAEVDPKTGEYVAPEHRGQYLVFPRGVEKKTYLLRGNYLEGVPLAFEAEEEVEGVKTYRFTYRGRAEYTESYGGTDLYPGVPVEPGQEIRCGDDRFSYRVWVEPLTGEILKTDEDCRAGDYIYDIATGSKVAPVLRWGGATAGDDVLVRAEQIRGDRTRLLWLGRYLPAAFALAGLALLAWQGIAWYRHRSAG